MLRLIGFKCILADSIPIFPNSLAWVLSWNHLMEKSQTISSSRVCVVIIELSDLDIFWAD
jgi:hypothetical protein